MALRAARAVWRRLPGRPAPARERRHHRFARNPSRRGCPDGVCLILGLSISLALPAAQPRETTQGAGVDEPSFLQRAIAAGDYLVRSQRSDGTFVYMRRPVSRDVPEGQYNWLRHCGTAYALWQLWEETGAHRFREAASKATERICTGPLQERSIGTRRFLVLVSDPVDTGSKPEQGPVVKTGGCALAAVALLCAHKALPQEAYLGRAERLADYLVSVTDEQGGVKSKYLLASASFSPWESDYYPGEAALALAMLGRSRPAQEREAALVRILLRLLGRWRERNPQRAPAPTDFFDHWAVLALVEAADQLTDACIREHAPADVRGACLDLLLGCAAVMADLEVSRQVRDGSQDDGSFTPRTGLLCPTAIRLEGMLGLAEFLRQRRRTPPQPAQRELLSSIRPPLLSGLV